MAAMVVFSTVLGLGFDVILLGLCMKETVWRISPAARMRAVEEFFFTILRGEKELWVGRVGSVTSSF